MASTEVCTPSRSRSTNWSGFSVCAERSRPHTAAPTASNGSPATETAPRVSTTSFERTNAHRPARTEPSPAPGPPRHAPQPAPPAHPPRHPQPSAPGTASTTHSGTSTRSLSTSAVEAPNAAANATSSPSTAHEPATGPDASGNTDHSTRKSESWCRVPATAHLLGRTPRSHQVTVRRGDHVASWRRRRGRATVRRPWSA